MEVLFSIDPKDINDIITYYHRTVSFWDVQPIVVNAADLYYNRQEYENLLEKAIHINKDLFVIESQFVPKSLGDKSYGQTSIFFIISGIPYKCPSNYLTEKILRFSSNYCIFFRISTKTVKPSTDRENIRITDFNHKNILIHFESIYQQLVTYLHDEKLKLQEKCKPFFYILKN